MSLKKFIDNKEIYIKKNEKINKEDLELFSYNTLLNFEKLLEKNNTKKSRTNTKTNTKTKTKTKTKSGSNTKSNMIKRLIKREVIYNDLIELYYELNPLLKKVPEDVYEIILKKIKNLEDKDTNNKKINNILTEYFNDFKYNVFYNIKNVNNEYDIDNIFLAKKLSIDTTILNQPQQIELILDMFSKNILGELITSNNKFGYCRKKLLDTIVDIEVDDLEFENEDLIDEIYQQINEAKLSYNEFIKNQNNTMKYGITIFKQIEININNEIKKINENLNRFKSLIQFPNLEYISSKKYESVSSKKVRSLDINKNKRKTLKNRYISK